MIGRGCGEKKEKLNLKERIFVCQICGFECDRDLNAAINLKNMAASYAVTACGAINHAKPKGLAIAVKQEENDKVLNFV